MYHVKEGLKFERIVEPNPDKFGWVHIVHEESGLDIEIEPHSWASIVASVSPEGETGYTFGLAKAIHGVLSYMK